MYDRLNSATFQRSGIDIIFRTTDGNIVYKILRLKYPHQLIGGAF